MRIVELLRKLLRHEQVTDVLESPSQAAIAGQPFPARVTASKGAQFAVRDNEEVAQDLQRVLLSDFRRTLPVIPRLTSLASPTPSCTQSTTARLK